MSLCLENIEANQITIQVYLTKFKARSAFNTALSSVICHLRSDWSLQSIVAKDETAS